MVKRSTGKRRSPENAPRDEGVSPEKVSPAQADTRQAVTDRNNALAVTVPKAPWGGPTDEMSYQKWRSRTVTALKLPSLKEGQAGVYYMLRCLKDPVFGEVCGMALDGLTTEQIIERLDKRYGYSGDTRDLLREWSLIRQGLHEDPAHYATTISGLVKLIRGVAGVTMSSCAVQGKYIGTLVPELQERLERILGPRKSSLEETAEIAQKEWEAMGKAKDEPMVDSENKSTDPVDRLPLCVEEPWNGSATGGISYSLFKLKVTDTVKLFGLNDREARRYLLRCLKGPIRQQQVQPWVKGGLPFNTIMACLDKQFLRERRGFGVFDEWREIHQEEGESPEHFAGRISAYARAIEHELHFEIQQPEQGFRFLEGLIRPLRFKLSLDFMEAANPTIDVMMPKASYYWNLERRRAADPSRLPCSFYAQEHKCRYGVNCRFRHVEGIW